MLYNLKTPVCDALTFSVPPPPPQAQVPFRFHRVSWVHMAPTTIFVPIRPFHSYRPYQSRKHIGAGKEKEFFTNDGILVYNEAGTQGHAQESKHQGRSSSVKDHLDLANRITPHLPGGTAQHAVRTNFVASLLAIQQDFCNQLEQLELWATGSPNANSYPYGSDATPASCFGRDIWVRESPETQTNIGSSQAVGGGVTRVIEQGRVFEKGAVNISVVSGELTAQRAEAMRARGKASAKAGARFMATALSIVLHPASPWVPTLRGDVRLFELAGAGDHDQNGDISDFFGGGGADLTPVYLFEQDAIEFHHFWKRICDSYDSTLYPSFKTQCDAYFYIASRREYRGTGGIFFDELPVPDNVLHTHDKRHYVESFLCDVATGWFSSYENIVKRRATIPYGKRQKEWQQLRRGRYLEFNLLHDRGVRFGIESSGRMEAIMVSAPPSVLWKYNYEPTQESEEYRLLDLVRGQPVDWVSLNPNIRL